MVVVLEPVFIHLLDCQMKGIVPSTDMAIILLTGGRISPHVVMGIVGDVVDVSCSIVGVSLDYLLWVDVPLLMSGRSECSSLALCHCTHLALEQVSHMKMLAEALGYNIINLNIRLFSSF